MSKDLAARVLGVANCSAELLDVERATLKEAAAFIIGALESVESISKEDERRAGALFLAYFIRNYPSNCIIYDPAWHAPKIFRAAIQLLKDARLPQVNE